MEGIDSMRSIGVFVDTTIVNRVLDINIETNAPQKEEDRRYLSKIVEQYAKSDMLCLWVNPTVELEISRTPDTQRKAQLLAQFSRFHFMTYNKTIFPFKFPATFLTGQEKKMLEELFEDIPSFKKDEKIFADAVFNSQVEVLLTTDREHLLKEKFQTRVQMKGLDKKIKIFSPKQFFEYLQNIV